MLVGGKYRLVRLIGRGGQADVHEAVDESATGGERVPLKIMRPVETTDRAALKRLRREVLLAARIQHPNVARVYGSGQHVDANGREIAFITMELLDGEPLSRRLARRGRLTPDEALPIATQIASALAAAHAGGVVHRDLKPANVILVGQQGPERVVVTDFGLARAVDDEGLETLTATGEAVGTPQYMAPEQVRGAPASPAADLYALGVVLFELVTGELPFGDDPHMSAQLDKLIEPAPSARRLAPGLPVNWERTIARCLEISPARRFASPLQVVEALNRPAPDPRR